MSRVGYRRVLVVLLAAGVLGLGLAGSYSYGEAYWQHRGFAPVARLPHARIGRLLTVHFFSAALHRSSDYLVYLPPGYSTARRYPVYYLLHGAPGSPRDFISVVGLDVRLSNSLSEHQLRPMILVMPDGRPGGSTFFDSEWANTRAGAFESYVLDVVRDVDSRFAAIPSRQARVIAGYSAGGYGALNIALHHLAVFANVQSWSGYFVQSRKCCLAFADASPAYLAYNSPLYYARGLARAELGRYPLRVYMFTGRSDPDGREIAQMAAELRRLGAVANYNVYPGGHDWQVWYARVDAMMLMASQMVSHPLPVSSHIVLAASNNPPAVPSSFAPSAFSHPRRAVKHGHGLDPSALLGLMLALASAALINLGFLLQQRGLVNLERGGLRGWLDALRSRVWLGGQALGWLGFALQILAVALAPLSLVQAFAAGGLALAVPLAAGVFHQRVPRAQVIGISAMAAGLAVLPLGVPQPGGGISTAAAIGAAAVVLMAGAAVSSSAGPSARALAAGLFYGVADAGIKAVAVGVHAHGLGATFSGWALLALAATFAGFLAFQSSLRRGNAVSAIAVMTSLTTLTALLFGVIAFDESLGSGVGLTSVHLAAIALVLACVPVLAGPSTPVPSGRRALGLAARAAPSRLLRAAGAGAGAAVATALAVFAGTGLLYGLRGLGWAASGPRLADALPLLQLAGADARPLAQVAVAWLLAGAVLGLMLRPFGAAARVMIAGALGLLLLLFASEASFAVARNLRLSDVLAGRVPGVGAWLEGLLLCAGAALPEARWLQGARRCGAALAATVRGHARPRRLVGGLPDSRGGGRPRHADAAGA